MDPSVPATHEIGLFDIGISIPLLTELAWTVTSLTMSIGAYSRSLYANPLVTMSTGSTRTRSVWPTV